MTQRPPTLCASPARLPVLLAACLLAPCAPAQQRTRSDLQAQATRLGATVRACAANADACRTGGVPEDEAVSADGARAKFTMRWEWLREALDEARTAAPEARQAAMKVCAERLDETVRQAGGSTAEANPQPGFAKVRAAADGVLSRAEFGAVAPPSLWDRFVARLWRGLGRLFAGFGRLGENAPWLGRALEWTFFLAAAVGLLFFLRRNFQRQRLPAHLRGETAARSAWDREATDWAALAEQAAGRADWRDAVHCLYWASIVRLESRRAWRHNPARTPREYVRLLKPGSAQRESLGGLTGLLERVWYGLRPAAAEDYRRAHTWFERLSETGLSPTPGSGPTPDSNGSAALDSPGSGRA